MRFLFFPGMRFLLFPGIPGFPEPEDPGVPGNAGAEEFEDPGLGILGFPVFPGI